MAGKPRTLGWAALLLLLWTTGCSFSPRPDWLEVEGYGVVVPWRKPGEAVRAARAAALQEAQVKIWSEMLPEKILADNTPPISTPSSAPISTPISALNSTPTSAPISAPNSALDSTPSSAPSSAPTEVPGDAARLLPLGDNPSSSTWKTDAGNAALGPLESSLYETMTIEQLAAICPAFRAKFRHMIGSLDPENVAEGADGRVAVRIRIDRNAVFALARKYLEQQKKL